MAFVKLVGLDGTATGSWAKVGLGGNEYVADFAKRACLEFPFAQVTAAGVSLYRVEWTSAGDPDVAAERAALSAKPLQSRVTLEDAGIVPNSCVLVRKIVGAAGPGACACQCRVCSRTAHRFLSLAGAAGGGVPKF